MAKYFCSSPEVQPTRLKIDGKMDEPIKTTLRYDSGIEKLLQNALGEYKITTLNKLIIHLIKLALIENPKEIGILKKTIKVKDEQIRQIEKSKSLVESRFNQFKELLQLNFSSKNNLANFLYSERVNDGKGGAYSKSAYDFFESNKISYTREELNNFSQYLIENRIDKPTMNDFKTFKLVSK